MSDIKQYILSPDEIIYLAKTMKAKYLDAAYIANSSLRNGNSEVADNNSKLSLLEKKYIEESLRGDISVDEELVKVISPLFFGMIETSFMFYFLDKTRAVSFNLHHGEFGITQVELLDNTYILSVADKDYIIKFVKACVEKLTMKRKSVSAEDPTHLISIKRCCFGEDSLVKTYIVKDSSVYEEINDEEKMCDKETVIHKIVGMLFEED